MKLTILHLTDLHVCSRITYFKEKVESISKIINSDSFCDNVLILFSGDLSYSGKEEQFTEVYNFISNIKTRLNKTVSFAFCPGNHDRQFPTNVYLTNEIIGSINTDNFCEFFNKYSYLNRNYLEFLSKFDYTKNYQAVNEVLGKYLFDFNDEKVCVYALNDSLLSTFNSNKCDAIPPVFIPKDKLNIKRGNEKLSILLTHIPLNGMRDDTRNYLKSKCKTHIDFIVDGHTHEEEFSIYNNDILEITSTALHIGDASGFSIIHIDNCNLSLRIYSFDDEIYAYVKKENTFNKKLQRKLSTSDGLFVNDDILMCFNEKKLVGGYEIGLDELFVFPRLVERKYINKNERKIINNFDDFLKQTQRKSVISIYGEQECGKTTLAYELFASYLKHGFSPLICDGNDFNKKKTKKSMKELIDMQIKNNYTNNNAVDLFYSVHKDNRILIIDNSLGITGEMLREFDECFSKIITLADPESDELFSIGNTTNLPSIALNIDFFYRDKREELYKKIYHSIGNRKPEIFNNLTLDNFISKVEEAVERIEQKVVIDLNSLIDFCGSALVNIDIINGTDTQFIGNRYQLIISDYLNRKAIIKISSITIERILGRIAFKLYEQKQTIFDEAFVEQIKNEYSLEYDETLKSYPAEKLVKILTELKLIKSYSNSYLFNSRNIFAHYIGFHAMHEFDNNSNPSCLEKIISNGVYLPLNFAILMDIAVSRNNEKIMLLFIDALSKDILDYTFKNKDIQSIAKYFDSERKRVIEIDESDIDKRRRMISKKEEKQRQEYLDNSNNYFYEKLATKEIRKLVETFNKSRILATLMNHGDMLKQYQKERLCMLNLTYPNIVIDEYITFIKKSFDELYVKVLNNVDEAKADKNFEKDVNTFFDFLLSFVTATILGIYDSSSRPIHSASMSSKLLEYVKNKDKFSNSFMPDIQRLMLLSFSRDLDTIYSELKEFTDKTDNKYYAQCAFLIGRRVVMDNYNEIRKNKRNFFEYIKSNSSSKSVAKLLIQRNK